MRITKKNLRQIIKEELLREPLDEVSRSSVPDTPGARGREVRSGYPGPGFDWNDCVNEIDFEPSFDDPGWTDGSIKPSDIVVYASDGSTARLTGDGLADESVYVTGNTYAPTPKCWIVRSGDQIKMGWGYIPEYSYVRFNNDWDFCTDGEPHEVNYTRYPVMKRWSIVLNIYEGDDGEYVVRWGDEGSSGLNCAEGSYWQEGDCESDCCLADICGDMIDAGYRKYSDCEQCAEEAYDCFSEEDLPGNRIDWGTVRR
jgi:hypothetical protein